MKKRQKNSFGNNTSIVLIVTVLVVIVGCVIGYYLYKKNKNITSGPSTKTTTKPVTKTTTKHVTKITNPPKTTKTPTIPVQTPTIPTPTPSSNICKPADPLGKGKYSSSGVCELTSCDSSSYNLIKNNSFCVSNLNDKYATTSFNINSDLFWSKYGYQGTGYTSTFIDTHNGSWSEKWDLSPPVTRFRKMTYSLNPISIKEADILTDEPFGQFSDPDVTSKAQVTGTWWLTDDKGNKMIDTNGNTDYQLTDTNLHTLKISNYAYQTSNITFNINYNTNAQSLYPGGNFTIVTIKWIVDGNINITI